MGKRKDIGDMMPVIHIGSHLVLNSCANMFTTATLKQSEQSIIRQIKREGSIKGRCL